MRYLRFVVAGLVLIGVGPSSLHAASSAKAQCKKIHDAVWAGKTLEQITAEFDTDAATVMKCTQKRGKRKAAPKAKKQKSTKGGSTSSKAQSHTGTSSAEKSQSSSPSTRKPPPPRSGSVPPYLP
jgi:hypothetical protein